MRALLRLDVAERFRGVPGHPYENGFANQPLRWKKPRTIFVNSMSDLFHPEVPEEYIQHAADRHRFQVLTKR